MTYLIFGGSGFIGTHTINAIRESNADAVIYNLDIEENNHGGKSIFIFCNVENEIVSEKLDFLIGYIHHPENHYPYDSRR